MIVATLGTQVAGGRPDTGDDPGTLTPAECE